MSEPELNVWERAMGWRKRQMVKSQINEVSQKIRNDTIEEIAKEIEKMTAFGQVTIDSFTVYIRSMKK
jgi:hypothetical protein